jgi:hypothetical protein
MKKDIISKSLIKELIAKNICEPLRPKGRSFSLHPRHK